MLGLDVSLLVSLSHVCVLVEMFKEMGLQMV